MMITLGYQKKNMEKKFSVLRHIFRIDIFYTAGQNIGSYMKFQKKIISGTGKWSVGAEKYQIYHIRIMGHLNFGLTFVSYFGDFNHMICGIQKYTQL